MLGLILFLGYMNHLPKDIISKVRLFADTLDNKGGSEILQRDLDRLQAWKNKWDMEFNPSKYKVNEDVPSRTPLDTQYILHGITKTCLFKYIENFTTKKMKIFR